MLFGRLNRLRLLIAVVLSVLSEHENVGCGTANVDTHEEFVVFECNSLVEEVRAYGFSLCEGEFLSVIESVVRAW